MAFDAAMDEETLRQVGLHTAMLVLVFGYEDGDAAILGALEHALDDGTWDLGADGFPIEAMRQDEELRWRIVDPALRDHMIARVRAWLTGEAGLEAVAAYVAGTLRDFGPVGGGTEGAMAKMAARFPA